MPKENLILVKITVKEGGIAIDFSKLFTEWLAGQGFASFQDYMYAQMDEISWNKYIKIVNDTPGSAVEIAINVTKKKIDEEYGEDFVWPEED